jgi:hypothetical protein
MTEVLINFWNTKLNSTATFNKVAYYGAYSPRLYRFAYVRTSTKRYKELTFDEAWTLKWLAFPLYIHTSHFDNTDNELWELKITLQENVGWTWTDRTSWTLKNNEYLNGHFLFRDYVYVEFDNTYSIDTQSNKWRFEFSSTRLSGTDAQYFYIWTYNSTTSNICLLPILEETETFDNNWWCIFNFWKLIIDEPSDFVWQDISWKGWESIWYYDSRLLFINGATKANEKHPKIIFTENAWTCRIGWVIWLSSSNLKEEYSFIIAKDENNLDQKITKEVKLLWWKHSSIYRGFFYSMVSWRWLWPFRWIKILSEFNENYKAVLKNTLEKWDTTLILDWDYSWIWEVWDDVYLTTPMYAKRVSYQDYNRQEFRKINSIIYDSNTNETTIELDSWVSYYYDFNNYNNLANSRSNCNINPDEWTRWVLNIRKGWAKCKIMADEWDYCRSSSYNHRMVNILYNAVITIDWCNFRDWYNLRADITVWTYTTPNVYNYQKLHNVVFVNTQYPLTFRYTKKLSIYNHIALLWYINNARTKPGRWFNIEYCSNITAKNIYSYWCNFIYTPFCYNIEIENIYIESDVWIYLTWWVSNYVVKNITTPTIRRLVYCTPGAWSVDVYNAKIIIALYHSSYNEITNQYAWLGFVGSDVITAGNVNLYNCKVWTLHDVVHTYSWSSSNFFVKNLQATWTIYRQYTSVEDKYAQLSAWSILSYENYLNNWKYEAWTTEWHILGIPDWQGWFEWELSPHNPSWTMSYKKNSFITKKNETISVVALIKILDEDFYSWTHMLPTLSIKWLGLDWQLWTINTAISTTEWQTITVSWTPTDTWFFDIELNFQTNSPNNKVLLRSIQVIPNNPRSTSDLSTIDRWIALNTIVKELNTANDVWAVPSDIWFVNWSMWEKLNSLENYDDSWLNSKLDIINTLSKKILKFVKWIFYLK